MAEKTSKPKQQQKKQPEADKKQKVQPKAEKAAAVVPVVMVPPRLRDMYAKEVIPQMRERFQYKNVMQIPRVQKVIINVGLGTAVADPKQLDAALADIGDITGQRPIVTRAKKSISNFKIRAGMRIGVKVTLRRERMYHFLDKLFNVVMPRLRDFQGVSPDSFDGRGNFAMGLREQIVFPEIDYDRVDKTRGMDIIVVTSAKTDEEARELLRLMGLPFAARRTGDQEMARRAV